MKIVTILTGGHQVIRAFTILLLLTGCVATVNGMVVSDNGLYPAVGNWQPVTPSYYIVHLEHPVSIRENAMMLGQGKDTYAFALFGGLPGCQIFMPSPVGQPPAKWVEAFVHEWRHCIEGA